MASLQAIVWKPLGSAKGYRLLLAVGFLATVDALRMINLDAPESALQGETIQLVCSFQLKSSVPKDVHSPSKSKSTPGDDNMLAALGNHRSVASPPPDMMTSEDQHDQPTSLAGDTDEMLYAVKWYKDEREFFRFLGHDLPRKQALPMDGLLVDMAKSDNNTVVLRNISLKTSGQFRCEVSTDAPHFVTKSIERQMFVYALPDEGPRIEPRRFGLNQDTRLFLSDQLDLTCSAPESKPAAVMDWIINDSLNLSVNTFAQFQINRRRLVRFPLLNGSLLLQRGQQIGSATNAARLPTGGRQHTGSLSSMSYMTYEIRQDGSLLEVNGSDQQRRVIESHQVVLDQLLESSQTNLKLTVDADLLGLLLSQQRSANAPNTSHPQGSIAAELDRFASLRSRSIQVTDDISTSMISAEPASTAHFGSTARRKSYLKSSVSPSSSQTGSNGSLKQESVVLKVKCVARVLHLSMSDELKIRIYNRTRTDAENLQQTDFQRSPAKFQPRQRSNSADSLVKMSTRSLTICLIGQIIAYVLSTSPGYSH